MTAVHPSTTLRHCDPPTTSRAANVEPVRASFVRRALHGLRVWVRGYTPLETATDQALEGIRGVHSVHR